MKTDQAFDLFNRMIVEATAELLDFTRNHVVAVERKADKSVVTECDKRIDDRLSAMARAQGLQVVSEEGAHVLDIVRSGNYLTIDPIDGTLGYLEYVEAALQSGSTAVFPGTDRGPASDFCLLLGLVENGIPTYAACYNFVTGEKILIDGAHPELLVREHDARGYDQPFAVYVDQRPGDAIEDELKALPDVAIIKQATLGLKSIYTILNPHLEAITVHRVQTAGLWDILPAAVACRAFDGAVYDDLGAPLNLREYLILPGRGATIMRGESFAFVLDRLKGQ